MDRYQHWRSSHSSSGDITRVLALMVYDEPVVRHGIRIIQHHCLSGGLNVHFGSLPPTPRFERHLNHHFLFFCREAIEALLTVGFVPYRLRTLTNDDVIPEVLPLGTYSWCVVRQSGAHEPLLRYDVHSVYCAEPVRVHTFTPPSTLSVCTSPMATLEAAYHSICHKRECVQRADAFNSHASMVFEQQDHTRINDIAKNGATIASQMNHDRLAGEHDTIGGRMKLHYDLLAATRPLSRLPEDTVAIVAPIGQTVHGLDRVVTPQLILREELGFARSVAAALGIPPIMLLQGSGAVGSSADSTSSSSGSWADSAESNNRTLLDTCRYINLHLELLLEEVYRAIYPDSTRLPSFRLVAVPTFSLEQLNVVFNARLIDDDAFSDMLFVTWGASLGGDARAAREEQRKAEFVLPFRDRVTAPAKKK